MRVTTFLSIVVFFFMVVEGFADEGKVNFSGEWSFNEEKSDLGEGRGRRRAALKLTVTQKGNDLIVERLSRGRSGEEFTSEEKLTLDGKECTNTFRERPRTSVVKWSDDGKSLTITSKMVFDRGGQEFEINSSEIWSLKEDGKVLSIASSISTPRGERSATYVYDKAKVAE
jgi:hypothetical protein